MNLITYVHKNLHMYVLIFVQIKQKQKNMKYLTFIIFSLT